MAEKTDAIGIGHWNAAEAVAKNVWGAVVLGEPLIDEGVIGRQQFHDVTVLADDMVEEHFRFAAHRL